MTNALKQTETRKEITAERMFLNYAGPCLDSKKLRGVVRPEHYLEVQCLIKDETENPRRSLLRYVFRDAYEGMKNSAEKLDIENWTKEAIRDYFINEHNKHVDTARGRVPEAQLSRCRVSVGKVVEVSNAIVVVDFSGERENVLRGRIDAKEGNTVAIHFRQIVDILD